MQLQLRTDHDDRTAGIVDALAEQVLAEAALLALEHVGQRLQRTLVGAGDDAAAAAVVEQRIDRFLQHALFVADDDVRRAQLDQPLQAVVAVDDAAIEIVQVGRREAAAIQRHQRAQVRRDDRNDLHDHPFRTVAGFDEVLDDLQALQELLRLQLGVVSAISTRRSPAIFSRSMPARRSWIASAPIMAVKLSSPIFVNGEHVVLFAQKLVQLHARSGRAR